MDPREGAALGGEQRALLDLSKMSRNSRIEGWRRVGVVGRRRQNANESSQFQHNACGANDFAPASLGVGLHPFAKIRGLCQRDVTRNVHRFWCPWRRTPRNATEI